jgi:hypothetical protein
MMTACTTCPLVCPCWAMLSTHMAPQWMTDPCWVILWQMYCSQSRECCCMLSQRINISLDYRQNSTLGIITHSPSHLRNGPYMHYTSTKISKSPIYYMTMYVYRMVNSTHILLTHLCYMCIATLGISDQLTWPSQMVQTLWLAKLYRLLITESQCGNILLHKVKNIHCLMYKWTKP